MNYKLYYFTFFNKKNKKVENLEVKAVSFADAMPTANIFRHTLRSTRDLGDWDIVAARDTSYNETEN
tara:strand:+ start:483 stop:683 length:201 start_codon:yes stop_codon:yes gene_type:complete